MRDSIGVATSVEQQREKARVGGVLTSRDRISVWGLVAGLIPFAVAFAVYLFVFLEIRPDTTGDEPHYLITAESIAYDLDVDLRNDYASAERVLRVVNVFPLGPDAFVYKESGELRPFRGVGLPAVLAPAVRIGGLTGARLMMVLIAALLADQLYRLLRDLRLRWRYRVLAWAAAVFCLPVLVFTSQVYPELPGALLIVVALRVMVVGASKPAALALGSSAAAALAWLHVRYVPLSLGIVFGLALAAGLRDWRPVGRNGGSGEPFSGPRDRRSMCRRPREALAHSHFACPRALCYWIRITCRSFPALVWEPRSLRFIRGVWKSRRRHRTLGLLVPVRSERHPRSCRRLDPLRAGALARIRGSRVPCRRVRLACGGMHRGGHWL